MGKQSRDPEDMILKPKPTHWASYATPDGGALFNGTHAEAVATLIQFCRDFGQLPDFECGMGARQDMGKLESETVN